MKLRKTLTLALAGLAVTGLLVACGNQKTASTATAKSSQKQTTVIAATGGAPMPFTFEKDGQLTGHNIELLEAVFDKLPQYKLEIVKVDFAGMFSGVSSGRYQLAVNNLAKNEEREKNYQFSDPIFKNSYVVIFKNGNKLAKEASEWTDLAGPSTVGSAGVNSTTAIEDYNKANPDKEINLNYSGEDLKAQLQGVESGKYDFLVMDKPMFEYYQKEYDLDLVGKDISGNLSSALMAEPYSYFVLGKEDSQLTKDVNQALKEVIQDGTSKKINDKYFGTDYSPSYDK